MREPQLPPYSRCGVLIRPRGLFYIQTCLPVRSWFCRAVKMNSLTWDVDFAKMPRKAELHSTNMGEPHNSEKMCWLRDENLDGPPFSQMFARP